MKKLSIIVRSEKLDDVKNDRVDSEAAEYDTDWNMEVGDQAEVSDHWL